MSLSNNKYKIRLKSKHAEKPYGPIIIPQREEKETVFSRIRAVGVKVLNYPNKKLLKIAGIGAVAVIFAATFTFQFMQYRLHASGFSVVGKNKFLEQKKILSILGEPVRIGHIFPTEANSIKDTEADIIIPIQGTRADGQLIYHTDKINGSWVIRDMKFEFVDDAGGIIQIIRGPEMATE